MTTSLTAAVAASIADKRATIEAWRSAPGFAQWPLWAQLTVSRAARSGQRLVEYARFLEGDFEAEFAEAKRLLLEKQEQA